MKSRILVVIITIILCIILFSSIKTDYKTPLIETKLSDVSNGGAVLIKPKYYNNETIVADYVLEPSNNDRTSDIENALNSCRNNHGGTVYLKAGVYKISKTILIPRGCTLMGDWQDPDTNNPEYGTIIKVDVNKIKELNDLI